MHSSVTLRHPAATAALGLRLTVPPTTRRCRYFVEFGVEDGSECNSYNLWRRYGWHGLLMDGDFTNRTLNLHRYWR